MAWKRRSMALIRPAALLSIYLSSIFLFSICFFTFPSLASAKVKGACVNCHTMHNSQGGTEVALKGTGVGWNGSTLKLTGGTVQTTPIGNLLVADCVGCHSATTADTIIEIGENKIPIVFNTNGYPTKPLAGGNFYYVSLGGLINDQKGHNVKGISEKDAHLNYAPGGPPGRCSASGGTGCHANLVVPKAGYNTGCQGCHFFVSHHDDGKCGYRFLNSHDYDPAIHSGAYVVGLEDTTWEQNATSSVHNEYKGDTSNGPLHNTHAMSAYCGGCHGDFHNKNKQMSGGAWVRHPSDAVLPGDTPDTEYEYYNNRVTTGEYNPLAPVARINVSSVSSTVTIDSDMVMCLSCHRPHGSPYADILRWPYNPDIDQIGGAFPFDKYASGCVICHTQKIPYSSP